MFNPDFNTSAALDAILPIIFGDDVPAETASNLSWYYHEKEDDLHRWEVSVYHAEDDGVVLTIHAPAFKEGKYTYQMTATWTNYSTSHPYLCMYAGGRDWHNDLPMGETIEEQARLMATGIKEAFDRF